MKLVNHQIYMDHHYEENPMALRLKESIDQSIYWNVHPNHTLSMDLFAALNHISLLARGFRRKLLENTPFEADAKVIYKNTDHLQPIYFDVQNTKATEGRNPFGMGYPLFISKHKSNPTRTIVTPLFIWYLDIKPFGKKQDAWQFSHQPDYPVVPNYYLLDYWKEAYGVDYIDTFESFCQNKPDAFQNLKPLMEGLAQRLGIKNMRPPNGIKAAPMPKELARVASESVLYWSGIFAAYPVQHRSIFNKLITTDEPSGISSPKKKTERINEHPFGLWPSDPSQIHLLQNYMNESKLLIQGSEGSGKTYTLMNLAVNMLSNGDKVLFVSPYVQQLAEAYSMLDEKGLSKFGLLISDPHRDLTTVLHKLNTGIDRRFSNFDVNGFKSALDICRKAKKELDEQFATIKNTKFGAYVWTDVIGLFLSSNKIEGREIMANQLKVEDFKFNYTEFDIIRNDLRICEPLYKKLNTLKHPLDKLHKDNFKTQAINEGRRNLENKIDYFLQKISQLKYRYFTKVDGYKNKLHQLYHRRAEEVQTQLDQYKINVNNYTSRFGNSFGRSNGPLRVFSVFSNKHKQILESKAKLSTEYHQLRQFFTQQHLFNFKFLNESESKSIPKIKKSIIAFEKQLHKWLNELEKVVDAQTQALTSQKALEEIDVKSQLEELEYAQQVLIEEINATPLYETDFSNEKTLLTDRIKKLEEISEELEATKLSLRDFEDFYKWKHYWISLPELSKNVMLSIIKNKPQHWSPAFESWYLHQYLKLNYDSSPIADDVDLSSYLEAVEKLREHLPAQIEDRWLKRRDNSLPRKISRGNYSDLAAALNQHSEALSSYFPIMLCTPDVATELIQAQTYDYILVDDAHGINTSTGAALEALAPTTIIAGDEGKKALIGGSMMATQLGQKMINKSLRFQHLRSPSSLLKFSNLAFDNRLKFLHRNIKLYTQECKVHAVQGNYDTSVKCNEEEVEKVMDLIFGIQPLPDHNLPKVSIICFSKAQRNRISEELLTIKKTKGSRGEYIQKLYHNGLGIHSIEDMDAITSDLVIVLLGFDTLMEEDKNQDIALLNQPMGLAWLNALCAGNYHQIHFCHSLSEEAIQEGKNNHRFKGYFLLTNFISYLSAIEQEDVVEQKAILRQLAIHNELKTGTNGLAPHLSYSTPPFLKEVGIALEPYFETGRVKYNAMVDNIILPLVIKPKYKAQQPWVIQADGSFFPSQSLAYEWDAKTHESISFLGLKIKNLWSVEWWKSPQQSARVLASEIIRYDSVFEEVKGE